jgi:hypothetical protein
MYIIHRGRNILHRRYNSPHRGCNSPHRDCNIPHRGCNGPHGAWQHYTPFEPTATAPEKMAKPFLFERGFTPSDPHRLLFEGGIPSDPHRLLNSRYGNRVNVSRKPGKLFFLFFQRVNFFGKRVNFFGNRVNFFGNRVNFFRKPG